MAGDFNANLDQPEGDRREEEIAEAQKTTGLEDMWDYFLPQWRPWCQVRRTWSMVWLWREVRSRMDYILGADLHLFRNVAARDQQHNLNHYMVLGCLCSAPLREHTK